MAQDRARAAEGVPVQRHVADNLRYGDEQATDEELWHVLEIAQGSDFVSEMPEGLEALVDQGGTNVSGGQRQRLAIARALAKQGRDLHLRRQLLGARLHDRRPAAGGPQRRRPTRP